MMQDKPVLLAGIEYLVTEADGQVIFRCNDGMSATVFAFEWTGCGWYLVALEDQWERVFARHVTTALEWVERNFEITYTNGTGVASLRFADA